MIDDKDAINKLKGADKQGKESAKALQKVGDTAKKVGKAVAIGIGLAVTSLTAMAFKSAEAADRIDKMSQQLGLSRKAFQEWDYVLSQNGVSIDSMKGGMKTLTNMTDDLRSGTKTATDAFGRLGISMDDIDGKSQEEVFSMVINSLQGVEDESQRAALANDLLGRSGADLAPLLNAGADSAEALKEKARELGLVLSDESIDAGVEFTDTIDTLKRSFGAIASEIGLQVVPIFQKLAAWVIKNMPKIKAVASDAFDKVGNSIKWVKDNSNWLIPVLGILLTAFVALKVIGVITTLMLAFKQVQLIAAAAGGILNAVMSANPAVLVALGIGVLIAAIVALVMNFDKVKGAAVGLWNKIKEVFGNIRDFVTGIFRGFRNVIKMPTLSIRGSLNPMKWLKEGLPKLNVKWNADGGIFKKPTIFNTGSGLQGVGEAGAEAIMPLSRLESMIDMNKTEIDYKRLAQEIRMSLLGLSVNLDGGALVGQIIPAIDMGLGRNADRKKRGG